MKKYITSIFTREIAVSIFIFALFNFPATPDIFIIISVYLITTACVVISLIKNYLMYFNRAETIKLISKYIKRDLMKKYSKAFKFYTFIIFIVPLILNPVLTFIYLDSLTLSIIWAILLLEGINNYLNVKKIKKQVLIGEDNV